MNSTLYKHLSALSEPLRARLLRLLEAEELGVGELVRILQTPQSTISRHLKLLREQGWLERRASGTASLFRLAEPLPDCAADLWAVVRGQLDGAWPEDLRRLAATLAAREMDSATFFGRHAGEWDALRRGLFGEGLLLPTLMALLPEGLTVADLGCGTGGALAALAPSAGLVIGVDREQAMLDAAAVRLGGLGNVSLRLGDLSDLPIDDGALDAAICMLVLHHVADLEAAMTEISRALAPGGRLILLDMQAHDRREYRRTMGHKHLGFSEAALAGLARGAGLRLARYTLLPPQPDALGPGLFNATLVR